MVPSVKVQCAANQAEGPSTQVQAAAGDRFGGGATEVDGAAKFRVETAAADEDLFRRVQRQVQRDRGLRLRSRRRWGRGVGVANRQDGDAGRHLVRDANVGAPDVQRAAGFQVALHLSLHRQVGVDRSGYQVTRQRASVVSGEMQIDRHGAGQADRAGAADRPGAGPSS